MEYKAKGYEGGASGGSSKRPLKKKIRAARPKEEPMNGLLVLSNRGFARFTACMKNPGEPTPANHRGAEMLRKLYGKNR